MNRWKLLIVLSILLAGVIGCKSSRSPEESAYRTIPDEEAMLEIPPSQYSAPKVTLAETKQLFKETPTLKTEGTDTAAPAEPSAPAAPAEDTEPATE
jgi:hypothetical protein